MKYKDLFKIKEKLKVIAREHNMSEWEKRKAISINAQHKIGLVDAYYFVVRCRNSMGSLAND